MWQKVYTAYIFKYLFTLNSVISKSEDWTNAGIQSSEKQRKT